MRYGIYSKGVIIMVHLIVKLGSYDQFTKERIIDNIYKVCPSNVVKGSYVLYI